MAIDLSADQALLDNLETVALSGFVPAILDAYRLRDHIVEGDSAEGGYLHRETNWHIGIQTPLDIDPQIGDVITDGPGVAWVIQDVTNPSLNDCWRLRTRVASITDDVTLQDQVTLYPAVDTVDAWGSQVRAHTTPAGWFTGIAAKIQLRPSGIEEYAGQREFVEIYDVYVAEDVGQVNSGDVLKDQDLKIYQIVSYRNRVQIDELSVIVCELRPRA